MGIKEIIMLYLTTYFIISVILTGYISSILSTRYQQITAKLPITFKLMLIVLYLTSIVSASNNHEPQVHEDLHEEMPEVVRRARHSDISQHSYQPPVFNYRTATQQDTMKTRYRRQQQADLRHLRMKPINPDNFFEFSQYLSQNRDARMNTRLEEAGGDWKPFQPQYVAPPTVRNHLEKVEKNRFAKIRQDKEFVKDNSFKNDLDIAGSENNEEIVDDNAEGKAEGKAKNKVETDRKDRNSRYIYVQPNILKNNFGIDTKPTQEMLKNAASAVSNENTEEFQISELQGLLGKNPEYQLQGLHKLLEDAKPIMQDFKQGELPVPNGMSAVEIQPSALSNLPSNQPPLDDLQEQLDAVNKAHAESALAAAQKQAEAHVRAQHEAIALAQKQAEVEALAKIAAHNQGKTMINPNEHLQILDVMGSVTPAPLANETPRPQQYSHETLIQQIDQNSIEGQSEKAEESAPVQNINVPETLALNARPFEQVLLHQPHGGDNGYATSFTDLRNSKPKINYSSGIGAQPKPFAKVHSSPPLLRPLAAVSEVYAPSEVQNYAPVIPKPYRVQAPVEVNNFLPVPTKSTFVSLPARPTVQEHRQDSYQQVNIDAAPSTKNHLYSEAKHEQYDDLHQYAAKYAFGYRILDEKHGNDFGHEEERDDKHTKGHYFVLLPDGRRQKVEYYVDNAGYHAKVSYDNVGSHQTLSPVRHHEEHVEHGAESEDVVHK